MKKKLCTVLATTMVVAPVLGSVTAIHAEEVIKKDGIEYIRRYSGSDRFSTAVDISKNTFPNGSDNLIIANGMNPADALSGGPLAFKLNAPILLSNSTTINASVVNEIIRLKPKNIDILGGINSVSVGIENAIKGKLPANTNIQRVAGADRFETSVKVADLVVGNSNKGVAFVNGATNKFPDALSAAPLVGVKGMPIILTDGKNVPNGATKYKSNSSNYIIGGMNTITLNGITGKRLAGADRFSTSAVVASEGFKYLGTDSNLDHSVVVVDGRNFPDALTSISLSKKYNAPVLLVSNLLSSHIDNYLVNEKRDKAYIVGGYNSVSKNIENILLGRLSDNFRKFRDYKDEVKSSAIRELEREINRLDSLINMLSKNSRNEGAILAFKSVRDGLNRDYINKSLKDLHNVSTEAILSKKNDLNKEFDKVVSIQDEQYDTILKNEIQKKYDLVTERGVLMPEEQMNSEQKILYSKLKEATRLLTEIGKNKQKLDMAYYLKSANISSSSSSTSVNSNLREANELLNIANTKRTNSPLFLDRKNKLEWAVTDLKKNASSYNLQILKDNTEDFRYLLNSYQQLEDRVNKAEKLIKDNKVLIEHKFRSKAFEKLSLETQKNELNSVIKSAKNVLNTFKHRDNLVNEEKIINEKIEKFANLVRNHEEIKNLDTNVKIAEDFRTETKRLEALKKAKLDVVNHYEYRLKQATELKDISNDVIMLDEVSYDKIRELNYELKSSYDRFVSEYYKVRI